MRTFSSYQIISFLALGTISIDGKPKKYDASTSSRLAFHPTKDKVVVSTTSGPVADGYIEVVEAFRATDGGIYAKVQDLPFGMDENLIQRIGDTLDAHLMKASQMAETAVIDQFDTFGWSLVKFWNKDGVWFCRTLNILGYQFTDDRKMVQVQGFGKVDYVDADKFNAWSRKPTVAGLTKLLENGIDVPTGYLLFRSRPGEGITLKNGTDIKVYGTDKQLLREGPAEHFTMPAIDVDGKPQIDLEVQIEGGRDERTVSRIPSQAQA